MRSSDCWSVRSASGTLFVAKNALTSAAHPRVAERRQRADDDGVADELAGLLLDLRPALAQAATRAAGCRGWRAFARPRSFASCDRTSGRERQIHGPAHERRIGERGQRVEIAILLLGIGRGLAAREIPIVERRIALDRGQVDDDAEQRRLDRARLVELLRDELARLRDHLRVARRAAERAPTSVARSACVSSVSRRARRQPDVVERRARAAAPPRRDRRCASRRS